MHREILREHVHRAILHRAAAGHDPGVIPIAGYQRIRLHERAGVQQLRHPFTGGQLASRALLCDSFRVSLQDALLFRQHLLQVLLTHVQNSLHVMPLSGREKLRLQFSPTFLILHVPPISCCPEKFCGFSEESSRIFVKIVRTVEISSKNAPGGVDRKPTLRSGASEVTLILWIFAVLLHADFGWLSGWILPLLPSPLRRRFCYFLARQKVTKERPEGAEK